MRPREPTLACRAMAGLRNRTNPAGRNRPSQAIALAPRRPRGRMQGVLRCFARPPLNARIGQGSGSCVPRRSVPPCAPSRGVPNSARGGRSRARRPRGLTLSRPLHFATRRAERQLRRGRPSCGHGLEHETCLRREADGDAAENRRPARHLLLLEAPGSGPSGRPAREEVGADRFGHTATLPPAPGGSAPRLGERQHERLGATVDRALWTA